MFTNRKLVGAIGATALTAGLTLAGAAGQAVASAHPSMVTLPQSSVPFTAHTRVLGKVAASQRLTIQAWLRPRLAAAQRYATAVSTPGNRLYGHYLSPDAYTARFGASRAAAASAEKWLRGQGFKSVHANSQRDYVRATGTVATIDAALHTTLKLYASSATTNAGPYELRANSTPITIPRSLAGSVLGVTGLDNSAPIVPLIRPNAHAPSTAPKSKSKAPHFPCSQYYGQHVISHLHKVLGETSLPTDVCGYSATQLRAAYGANFTNTGKGETIALIELGLTPDMLLTLQDYARANHMPAPSPERYEELSLGNGTACGDDFDIEEQLDVEVSYDMAPGANQLVVGGDSCNFGDFGLQGLFDADIAVLSGNGHRTLADAASNSWEGADESQPAFLDDIEHSYLLRAAAEGVGMYFASGDSSGVETPSSDPDAIGVGGTTLGIGQANNRLFETGWSSSLYFLFGKSWQNEGEFGAAGGGPSILWRQPAYQKGKVPASLSVAPGNRGGRVRSVPDISADADPFTGMLIGYLNFPRHKAPQYVQMDVGGTSVATPLVAGMVTAAQQGRRPFGLINPALYKLNGTSALTDTLPLTSTTPALYRGTVCDQYTCGIELVIGFDVQSYNMFGYTGQVTLKGYDNMTGVGTPNGQSFITAMRKLH
jgi:subtilase family serine protease